jgi:hypothetical protein
MPVLTAAGTDHRLGFLETGQLEFVEQGLSDMIDAVWQDLPAPDEMKLRVCCVPARARRDQLAGDMLAQLLRQKGHPSRSAAARMSWKELVVWVGEAGADVVYISVVAPTALIHARYLCSKLRVNFPELRIMVGLWGRSELTTEVVGPLESSGGDEVVTLFAEAVMRWQLMRPMRTCCESPRGKSPTPRSAPDSISPASPQSQAACHSRGRRFSPRRPADGNHRLHIRSPWCPDRICRRWN